MLLNRKIAAYIVLLGAIVLLVTICWSTSETETYSNLSDVVAEQIIVQDEISQPGTRSATTEAQLIDEADIMFNQGYSDIVIDSIHTKINSVETSKVIETTSPKEKTEIQYIIISMTLTNKGDRTETITSNRYTLFGANGQKYTAYDKSFIVRGDEMLARSEVTPDSSITKYVAFETETGATADKLQVYNSAQFMKKGGTFIILNKH